MNRAQVEGSRIQREAGGGALGSAIAAATVLSAAIGILSSGAGTAELTPVESISHESQNHIHGLGYDAKGRRLFVATHYGIFVWSDGKLFQFGQSRADYMGFSLHPTDPKIIYTSGHPQGGGNLGVMKSENGGATFTQIFRGLKGETVDFHSMAVSPANPSLLYGWYGDRLYRSKDAGKSWTFASARDLPVRGFCWGAPCLSPDGKKESVLYAGTAAGIHVSGDFGESWKKTDVPTGAVAALSFDPSKAARVFAFTQKFGVAVSQDGGRSWRPKNHGLNLYPKEIFFAFVFDRNSPEHVFAGTSERVFRTIDSGESWQVIISAER